MITYVRKHPERRDADVAASFQEAVVDVLVDQDQAGRGSTSAPGRSASVAGWPPTRPCGSASSRRAQADGLGAFIPSRAMCTDNAAMIGATAWYRLRLDGPTPLDAGADPNLRLPLIEA